MVFCVRGFGYSGCAASLHFSHLLYAPLLLEIHEKCFTLSFLREVLASSILLLEGLPLLLFPIIGTGIPLEAVVARTFKGLFFLVI